MPQFFKTSDATFEDRFARFLSDEREACLDVRATVEAIIAEVRERGDAAVLAYTTKFDRFDAGSLRFSDDEIDAIVADADDEAVAALKIAAERVRAYHARQRPADEIYEDVAGITLGHRWTAVQAAGLYVPGGLASYPSSVLMNAIPAKVAGVKRLAMAVPTPDGVVNPLVMAAAQIAGVDEIYRMGGAQAVAALAYGTQTIAPVDIITGPGNAFVAEAKRQVFGTVGIDMIAGPSEILVVADHSANPDWLAADLLSQAEHDAVAQSILLTDDESLADEVVFAVDKHLDTLNRQSIAEQSWRNFGAVIVAKTSEFGAIIDKIAPEHLELCVADPEGLMAEFTNAGAIFLGHHTPEVIGDYVAGPNHVLPTARSARFSSGLSVLSFMKRSTITRLSAEGLSAIGPAAATLADAEGLGAHALSVRIRMNKR